MDFVGLHEADGQGFLTSAADRAKNRVHVKRLYYKKLNLLDTLQRQADTLELQHRQLLAKCHQRDAKPTPPCNSVGPSNSMHKAYVELTQMQCALIKQNAELARLNTRFLAAEKQLSQFADAQNRENMKMQQEQEHKRKNPTLVNVRLTQDYISSIAAKAYGEFKAFRESKLHSSIGTTVFGWRHRHIFHSDKLMFALDKVFPNHSMQKMAQGIWEVVSQPELSKITSRRDATMHFHVVQRVSENAVVFFHTVDREDSDERLQAFILSMRIDLGSEGSLMIFRSLDPKTCLAVERTAPRRRGRKKIEPQKETIWLDIFFWSFCEYAGEHRDGCRYTYGGTTENTKLTSCGWWYVQNLRTLLAMENRVVGSQGLLQQ